MHEVGARRDVAPLVRAADLDRTAEVVEEVEEVVALEDLVAELGEGERTLARLQALLHALLREHLRHAEVDRDVAEKLDRARALVPVVVVHENGGVGSVEVEDARKVLADALLVLLHLLDGEHVALGGLAGRVADEARRAAHEGDHLVARLLETAEHHDGHEVPRLQRGGGGVEAAVHRLRRLQQFLDFGVCHGLHEAARLQFFQQRHLFVSFCLIPLDFRCSSEPCSLFVRTHISIAFLSAAMKDKDLPMCNRLVLLVPRKTNRLQHLSSWGI